MQHDAYILFIGVVYIECACILFSSKYDFFLQGIYKWLPAK